MYYSFLILIYKKILLFQTFDGQQKTAENGVSTTTGNLQCGHITVQKPSNRERNDNNITSENRCLFFISIYINIGDNFSELEKGGNQFITAYRFPMCLIKQMGKITFESEVHKCADAK